MNPCNVLTLLGDVFSDIRPLTSQRTGEVSGVFFHVRVPRAYRNSNGDYEYDVIPVQYHTSSDAVQKFALQLAKGDSVSIVGTVQVSKGSALVITDSVSLNMASESRLHSVSADDTAVSDEVDEDEGACDDSAEEADGVAVANTQEVKQLPLPF